MAQSLKERECEIAYQERRWDREKNLIQRETALKEEKDKILNPKKNKLPTSKQLIWFLFINCTIIELVVIIVTFQSLDLAMCIGIAPNLTPLVTLVGAIVSEVIGYAVYAVKSAKENTAGGITYDIAMRGFDYSPNQSESNHAVG